MKGDAGDQARKFWGWGIAGAGPDSAQQEGLRKSIATRLEAPDLKLDPEPRIQDIELREPRLKAPNSLAFIFNTRSPRNRWVSK